MHIKGGFCYGVTSFVVVDNKQQVCDHNRGTAAPMPTMELQWVQ